MAIDDTDLKPSFSFYKGGEDVVASRDGASFDWDEAATKVRAHLADAMNAKHVAFLLGSGCSSHLAEGKQVGIPTMKPMAQTFVENVGADDSTTAATKAERAALSTLLGVDLTKQDYGQNLERLMEVLYSFQFALTKSEKKDLADAAKTVTATIGKITNYILATCTEGAFSKGDESVSNTYQSFYRKLVYRDRALARPWVFTTNYDTFNEVAMDRLGIPYCNGFSGVVERRFNPATFRYSLAEQLDISSAKWAAVDNFVYLAKLHGSVSWIEEETGLFPVRELQTPPVNGEKRVLIYPTPSKQNASFGSPYSDLFREFQAHIVRDQSVLFVLGYSFCDEHINNILFQALTVPTFRMVAFVPPDASGIVADLKKLADPRIWLIGGTGPTKERTAHFFDTFVEKFMPETPGDKVDAAVSNVLRSLVEVTQKKKAAGDGN